ncbi:GNAT family N-acetyltransferase [Aquimarina sp. W85]|uniref:GNAT family N-acetyltransferase n=1 Tax=Aquimarina rhodophyticola TaxID=3342246 RepID=UPI003672A414
MKNIIYTTVTLVEELHQIIKLQQENLPIAVTAEEKEKEGFVTVQHTISILKKMNDQEPHIIAKDQNSVVGYALCMTQKFKNDIEILKSMFIEIDKHLNSDISYIIMGQICIDKAYRKQGVFRGLYAKMREELNEKYDLLITEVAADNIRSLKAHDALGFETLTTYKSNGIKWHLIKWDWR